MCCCEGTMPDGPFVISPRVWRWSSSILVLRTLGNDRAGFLHKESLVKPETLMSAVRITAKTPHPQNTSIVISSVSRNHSWCFPMIINLSVHFTSFASRCSSPSLRSTGLTASSAFKPSGPSQSCLYTG